MRSAKISRVIRWTLATGLTFLVFLTLMRFVFFYYFKPGGYSFSNCFDAFLLGLRYDLRTVCCIILPIFLIGNLHIEYREKRKPDIPSILRLLFTLAIMTVIIFLLKNNKGSLTTIISVIVLFALILFWAFKKGSCNPFANNFSKRLWKTYLLLVTIGLVIIYVVDLQHYDYLHQRLNASVLNYTEDAKISYKMVWQTYPVVRLLLAMIVAIVILYWLINVWYKNIRRSSVRSRYRIISFIIFFIVLAIGIFGRVGQYPLRWSDAFAFGDEFKASLSLNPVQSFFSTLQFRHSSYDEKKVRSYYPLVTSYLGVQNPDSVKLSYERIAAVADTNPNKPNVVLVICESFSAYKSSMWGNPLNTTPYFNEMCKQGVFFDHCFSPAYGTARGVWATITGIPDVESPNTASRNPAAVDQHTIINDLNGYSKFYFLGGSTSWANIRGLLTNNIKDLHLYEEGDFKAKAIDVWGISDKHLFLEANDILKQQSSPFFAVIQTADNHRPYTIPSEDKDEFVMKEFRVDSLRKYGFDNNAELNAFRYTDFCYQKFIEAAKKEKYFSNTIFVFVGDHGIRGNAGNMFPKCWTDFGITTQHVPLLFYSPGLLKPMRSNRTCSQVDILASVASLLKVPYRNTTMGRNLFDTLRYKSILFEDRAFIWDPDVKQIGMMTNDYCYVKNLLTGKDAFVSAKNNEPLPADATANDKKLLQELTEAWFETAKYMLLNNKKSGH